MSADITRNIYRGTTDESILKAFASNLKSSLHDFSIHSLTAGIISVLVSITGPTVVVFKSAQAGHLTTAQTVQWLSMVWISAGIFSFVMTFRYRMPILGAFSTPTVAFLVTAFSYAPLSQIVGAYLIASVLLIIIGITGVFETIIKHIPRPVIMAMLAGVLFPFGLDVFLATPKFPAIVISMVITYFVSRRFNLVAPILAVLVVGFLVALIQGKTHFNNSHFSLTSPHWFAPHFSFLNILTIAIPMVLLTLSTQFAPGMAVLDANNFHRPINQGIVLGGVLSLVSAGFLNSGTNCAAISAGIAASEHAEPDQNKRYTAGIVNSVCYLVAGLFASGVTTFFAGLPAGYLAALGGLGLLTTITSATHDAFHDHEYRDSAAVAFLVTISNIQLLRMGSPFWGLVAGVVTHWIMVLGKKKFSVDN